MKNLEIIALVLVVVLVFVMMAGPSCYNRMGNEYMTTTDINKALGYYTKQPVIPKPSPDTQNRIQTLNSFISNLYNNFTTQNTLFNKITLKFNNSGLATLTYNINNTKIILYTDAEEHNLFLYYFLNIMINNKSIQTKKDFKKILTNIINLYPVNNNKDYNLSQLPLKD